MNESPPPEPRPAPDEHDAQSQSQSQSLPALLVTETSTAQQPQQQPQQQSQPPPSPPKAKAKFSHTSELQLEYLVQWLEQPGNFALLTRPTREQVAENANANANANSKRLKKTDGYRSLAQYMNYKAQTQWTDKIACSRYKSFMASYYRAKRQRPLYLPPLYKRVDVLVSGDFPREMPKAEVHAPSFHIREMTRQADKTPLRTPESEELMKNSNVLNTQAETMDLHEREGVKTAESSLAVENRSSPSTQTESLHLNEKVKASEDFLGMKTAGVATPMSDSMPLNEKVLWLESQRLAVKQQELELKQLKQTQRVEMIVKLAAAGKSAEEVREYLAVMDQFD